MAHRDGTRSILQSAGLSFLFGMLLGDFVGGGAVVIGARAVLQSSYSRDVESAADRYGVDLMTRAGGDPRALGAVLNRIAGTTHPGVEILRDHPDTKARVAVINTLAPASQPARPMLEAERMARAEAYMHGPVRQAYLARRIQADPVSRLAVWARRVAGFAVAVMLLAIVIVRAGILEIMPSLATVGGAFILAGIAMLLAFAAFIVIWREGLGGFGMAMTALLVGVVILGLPRVSRHQGLPPAGDRRHHDRSHRPAALRSDCAAAFARRQSDRLCGLARRRIAKERLSEH